MQAVVLVGGEGTRLRPLTLTTPKPLLPIANQPFLERQLTWLAAHGITEAVLSLGYLPDAFVAHFPGNEFRGMRLRYAVEESPLGTAGGIRFAADGITDRFVVCNGDVLTTLDLGAMIRFHDARGAQATISLAQVEDPSAFGVVPTYDDGEVVGFIEKPPRDLAPTNWINAGTYVLEPGVLDRIPAGLNVSIERETFPRMVEERRALFAFASDAYWLDIGTPDKYVQAHLDVLGGALGDGALDALIDPTATVAPDATVHRSVVGPGAVIEAGATLQDAVVLAGARVGAGAEVRASVVGPGALIGAEAVLTDLTVIGADAQVAPGSQMAGGRVPSTP